MIDPKHFATDYDYECEACGCLLTSLDQCEPHTKTHIQEIAGFMSQFNDSPISMPIIFKTIPKVRDE